MNERRGRLSRAEGLDCAVRLLPRSEFAIRRLIDNSEDFRDLCADLAEAELALVTVSGLPEGLREVRKLEWLELVERLGAEIKLAVSGSEAWASRHDM